MTPEARPLRFYTQVTDAEPIDWSWVEAELAGADTYWVDARSTGHPHPRPVWGVWLDDAIRVSLGSPVLRRELAADPTVTVHLASGLDVVIVEGRAEAGDTDPAAIAAYDAKYDWTYDLAQYGPFTKVVPSSVFAWRAAGPAGRDGFRHAGRWHYP